ncbi:MAG: RsmB/NOP family class I SAM-dependent RNA methyltransferase [Candidatus Omnitrophica bacterium]|nr:RsmB/NOP family class I SAM-dependent RNA methyltransferase [Candidatus Omnitrophota bacterium]
MPSLPALFVERLKSIVPSDSFERVLNLLSTHASAGIRVNTLKFSKALAISFLADQGITVSALEAAPEIMIVSSSARQQLRDCELFTEGQLYWQAPSSALPVRVLAPMPGERVLDLCAAPGSKTTQMAALMNNEGEIIAIEVVKGRFFKLKSVCTLTGAMNVKCRLSDGRRFRVSANELFSKVLVDAPCSSEGRFDINNKETIGYWSPRKIKEMAHKQKGLLLSASRCVNPGGSLVYSTCTFAPEENEGVVDWFLNKTSGDFFLEAIDLPGVPRYPVLKSFDQRAYKSDLAACWRVLPDGVFSGFFIAKFRRS